MVCYRYVTSNLIIHYEKHTAWVEREFFVYLFVRFFIYIYLLSFACFIVLLLYDVLFYSHQTEQNQKKISANGNHYFWMIIHKGWFLKLLLSCFSYCSWLYFSVNLFWKKDKNDEKKFWFCLVYKCNPWYNTQLCSVTHNFAFIIKLQAFLYKLKKKDILIPRHKSG